MIDGRHVTHSAPSRRLVARRAPMHLNVVGECDRCGTMFVVYVPAGMLLTCGDCGGSKGVECPRCDGLVAFEAAPIGNEPLLLMMFDSDGNTVELP